MIDFIDSLELGEFYLCARGCANLRSRFTPYFARTDVEHPEMQFVETYINDYDRDKDIFDIEAYNADYDARNSNSDEEDQRFIEWSERLKRLRNLK